MEKTEEVYNSIFKEIGSIMNDHNKIEYFLQLQLIRIMNIGKTYTDGNIENELIIVAEMSFKNLIYAFVNLFEKQAEINLDFKARLGDLAKVEKDLFKVENERNVIAHSFFMVMDDYTIIRHKVTAKSSGLKDTVEDYTLQKFSVIREKQKQANTDLYLLMKGLLPSMPMRSKTNEIL